MRFVEVDREGNFKPKGDLRILYSVMLQIRVLIVSDAGKQIARGLTIAGRYAVNRRQFANIDNSKEERKLMDYQTHMQKFAPLLAYAYAFKVCGNNLYELQCKLIDDAKKSDFSLLDIVHHLSSGFKSFFTKVTYEGLDMLR